MRVLVAVTNGAMLTRFPPSPLAELQSLAKDAKATDEADWGSERQVAAENRFFDAFHTAMGDTSAFDDWCLKATSEEMLAEAMRLVEAKFGA
jgi:hypothetical protein